MLAHGGPERLAEAPPGAAYKPMGLGNYSTRPSRTGRQDAIQAYTSLHETDLPFAVLPQYEVVLRLPVRAARMKPLPCWCHRMLQEAAGLSMKERLDGKALGLGSARSFQGIAQRLFDHGARLELVWGGRFVKPRHSSRTFVSKVGLGWVPGGSSHTF